MKTSILAFALRALAEGRDLTPGAHEMIAGAELAHFLGMRPGDELGLPSPNPEARALKLVGTFRSSLDLYTADVVICDEEDARALLALPAGDATDLAIPLSGSARPVCGLRWWDGACCIHVPHSRRRSTLRSSSASRCR